MSATVLLRFFSKNHRLNSLSPIGCFIIFGCGHFLDTNFFAHCHSQNKLALNHFQRLVFWRVVSGTPEMNASVMDFFIVGLLNQTIKCAYINRSSFRNLKQGLNSTTLKFVHIYATTRIFSGKRVIPNDCNNFMLGRKWKLKLFYLLSNKRLRLKLFWLNRILNSFLCLLDYFHPFN